MSLNPNARSFEPGKAGTPARPAVNTQAKLFVGQLPFECTEARLHELFSAYGTVEAVHIMRDQRGASKGAAFITYATVEEADTAIFTLHDRYRMLSNRAVQVSYAKNSPNISSFGVQSAMQVHRANPSNPAPENAFM
uniref:RRM domain-containing protein n=1 Tax=Neobodo designis TaxID=312471 RepID=A0A7S1MFR7_NEODS|mmetsp:Transcript_39467/g.122082  ORF Transcript_39467/g.122082 Transcript_39467/m.122082 type:complete len:137 (+) Transcript_39467:59-469(+)|eukprot:CAMPEP_0174827786 /NCGR_PEP_ID=MMETSP1114-20130205/929_1 /TAXON_ID=312471 /ORGANISM="Neobodo designis, Strain CCAP 1951/1" /LENGTH=136 /DNA_ID=CAMNT_0016061463 /DNA_START=62 /DNA_END=472 /DNA_ORIENTATION=-